MANTYPAPYATRPKDSMLDPSTCYNRECVSYTAWKIREATGRWPKRTGDMDAKNWITVLPKNGYKKVSTPKNGGRYVGVLPVGSYGHVVWFEHDNVISEYNYDYHGNYGNRKVNIKAFTWFEIKAPAAPKPVSKKATVAEVTKAYQDLLKRKPDAAGLKNYTTNGMNIDQVRADIKGSAEYKKLQAKPKPAPKPAPKPTPKSSAQYYIVRKGDTVDKISGRYKLDKRNNYQGFRKLNPSVKNVNRINVGQKVRIK